MLVNTEISCERARAKKRDLAALGGRLGGNWSLLCNVKVCNKCGLVLSKGGCTVQNRRRCYIILSLPDCCYSPYLNNRL